MANVVAGREIVPEFIQHRAKPEAIARAVLTLMDDQSLRQRMIADFDEVIGKLAQGDADQTAAQAILAEISSSLGKANV